jgi:hypothetical protein
MLNRSSLSDKNILIKNNYHKQSLDNNKINVNNNKNKNGDNNNKNSDNNNKNYESCKTI